MQTSENINEIATALAKAQGEIQNPAKNRVNPHFKSKYADIADGLDVIRPTLSKFGIAFVQATELHEDMVILRTRMIHTSGQWLESTYPVGRFVKHQELGASLTYAKRQALFSIVGVAGDDDDDGNSATASPGTRRTSNAIKRENPEAWPTLEKAVRTAADRDQLTAVWREFKDTIAQWPIAWKEQADELFSVRAGEVAHRSTEVIADSAPAAEPLTHPVRYRPTHGAPVGKVREDYFQTTEDDIAGFRQKPEAAE